MFVAEPPLNLEGHAFAIELWKACLVETWHLAASAPCASYLHPSFLPQRPPVWLKPPFPFLWNNLVKSPPNSCCFNCLQSAADDSPSFLLSGGKRVQKNMTQNPNFLQPLKASDREKELCVQKCSVVPCFCLAACPHALPSQHPNQATIKHDRQSSSSVTITLIYSLLPCFPSKLLVFVCIL